MKAQEDIDKIFAMLDQAKRTPLSKIIDNSPGQPFHWKTHAACSGTWIPERDDCDENTDKELEESCAWCPPGYNPKCKTHWEQQELMATSGGCSKCDITDN